MLLVGGLRLEWCVAEIKEFIFTARLFTIDNDTWQQQMPKTGYMYPHRSGMSYKVAATGKV